MQMQRNNLGSYCSNSGNCENSILKLVHKCDTVSLGLKEKENIILYQI